MIDGGRRGRGRSRGNKLVIWKVEEDEEIFHRWKKEGKKRKALREGKVR